MQRDEVNLQNFDQEHYPCRIIFRYFAGKEIFIRRIPLPPPNGEQYPVPYERTQFPVRLCFAMIINKGQGKLLTLLVYKGTTFLHGQSHVVLSHARTLASVRVLLRPLLLILLM